MDFKDLKTKILAEIDRLISLYDSKRTHIDTDAGLAPILGAIYMLEYLKNQINGIKIDSYSIIHIVDESQNESRSIMPHPSFFNAVIFQIEEASNTHTDAEPSIGSYKNPASRPGRREAGRRMINFIHRLNRELKD